MKRIILICFALLSLISYTNAQSFLGAPTKLNVSGLDMLSTPNSIYLYTYHTIGEEKKVTFQAVESKNLKTGEIHALGRIMYGNAGNNSINTAFISMDDLISVIELISITESEEWNEEYDLKELEYFNIYGFRISANLEGGEWSLRINSDQNINPTSHFINRKSIPDVKKAFQDVLAKCEEILNQSN